MTAAITLTNGDILLIVGIVAVYNLGEAFMEAFMSSLIREWRARRGRRD